MSKITLLALVLALIFAPKALIFAQETGVNTAPAFIPEMPFDDLINKLLGGSFKDWVQRGMNQAQTGLENAAGQAADTAQDALQAELQRQAGSAVQTAKKTATEYVGGVVAIIKNFISEIISKIKIFFSDLFKKSTPTY